MRRVRNILLAIYILVSALGCRGDRESLMHDMNLTCFEALDCAKQCAPSAVKCVQSCIKGHEATFQWYNSCIEAHCGESFWYTSCSHSSCWVCVPPDFATARIPDGGLPDGSCGNGDSPDGSIGFCPCCEVRDEHCNIPPDNAKWCTDCLRYTETNGREGSLEPCIAPLP